jgi:hypothetical protein
MEQDAEHLLSPLLTKPRIQKQLEQLEKVVKEAQKRVDYTMAHDPEILKAINIVERFLRKKKRPCYGGQAINALLPKERQFYDKKFNIPDYDFFSPKPAEDIEELIQDLEDAGFEEIYKKMGVHDGTAKLYVNFVPIADISETGPGMYELMVKRARTVDGILYCDEDYLRMLMYLELSRPRGEVKRWSKVYERLTLLNDAYPPGRCNDVIKMVPIQREDRKVCLEYCIRHKNVVVGPEFLILMKDGQDTVSFKHLLNLDGPVIFFSSTVEQDMEDLKSILSDNDLVEIEYNKFPVDSIFNFATIKRNSKPIALIFEEDACHSYTTLHIREGREKMRLAMPDLYLHLYYSLMMYGRREKEYFDNSFECLIQKIHAIVSKARNFPTRFLPAFGIQCSGHQRGIATLLRARQQRMRHKHTQKKGKLSGGSASSTLGRRRSGSFLSDILHGGSRGSLTRKYHRR